MKLKTCPSCGAALTFSAEPGRVRTYRGRRVTVPHDVVLPTCVECGSVYVDGALLERLEAAFIAQLESRAGDEQ